MIANHFKRDDLSVLHDVNKFLFQYFIKSKFPSSYIYILCCNSTTLID